MITTSEIRNIFTDRPADANKGDFGYIALIGGSLPYSGAIRLADRAAEEARSAARLAALGSCAMRSGAGVAAVAAPKTLCPLIAPQILESTLFPLSDDGEGNYVFREEEVRALCAGRRAVAVGMGLGSGEETQKLVAWLLANFEGRLLIDADGLNALAKMNCRGLRSAKADVLLTPHPKEFARLLGKPHAPLADVLRDRRALAAGFAKDYGACVLLKGSVTYITDGTNECEVDRGCPGMATAGSGDVLSGVAAAVLGYAKEPVWRCAAAAAYVCGLAGELAQEKSCAAAMVASDTAACVRDAVAKIARGEA